MIAKRKSLRRIGVARNRFSSFRTRISTMTKPTPHMPPPISPMPIMPGSKKSMYRDPACSKCFNSNELPLGKLDLGCRKSVASTA
jgi:hypothetical protein